MVTLGAGELVSILVSSGADTDGNSYVVYSVGAGMISTFFSSTGSVDLTFSMTALSITSYADIY